MDLGEFISAIEGALGTVTHDTSVRGIPVEIDDTVEGLTLTVFNVLVDDGRLVIRAG